MKAIQIIKFGKAESAFKMTEIPQPSLNEGEVLIKNEAFGLNYADVLARLGQYRDCPKLPALIGYDVVGRVEATKGHCGDLKIGDRVSALTRFGGYAEFSKTQHLAAIKINDDIQIGQALALATQYSTAWVCAKHAVRMSKGDRILVQAAAGGVGQALVQLAKLEGCWVAGTAGSEAKIEKLKKLGVDFPINYGKVDFKKRLDESIGEQKIDIAFDSVGGKVFADSFRSLDKGGRIVVLGAANITGANLLKKLRFVMHYKKVKSLGMLIGSRGLVGVNMLRLADHKPQLIKEAFEQVYQLFLDKKIEIQPSKSFPVAEIVEAHNFLQNRQSMGKISVHW